MVDRFRILNSTHDKVLRMAREEPLTSYVRSQLRLLEARGQEGGATDKLAAMAKDVGLPPSGVNQVKNGKLGVSGGTVDRYAKMLGLKGRVELRAAADKWWETEGKAEQRNAPPTAPSRSVTHEDRYEHMGDLRRIAKREGYDADFVDAFDPALDYDGQPPFDLLWNLFKAEYAQRKGKLIPHRVVGDL